jgi:hypothetical protein
MSAATRLPVPGGEVLCRALVVTVLVVMTHQLGWGWLRFLTSEAILRFSASLGMSTGRVSYDTIRLHGELYRFVISCTFVDVFIGAIPLLWNLKKPLLGNLFTLILAAVALFGFNVVRLESGHVLHALGLPWTLADDVLGGFAYFAVWLFVWRQRSWELSVREDQRRPRDLRNRDPVKVPLDGAAIKSVDAW